MDIVDNYRFLVQTCDRDFETNCQTFARNLAEGIKKELKNLRLSQKRVWYVPLDVLGPLDEVELISDFAGDAVNLSPFKEWLDPNLERDEFSEEQVRYFQRRMGIIGRLAEKILNQLFAFESHSSPPSLKCRAVYVDSTKEMRYLRSKLIREVYTMDSGAAYNFYIEEMSRAPLAMDRDLSLRIEVGYAGEIFETSCEDPTISLPEPEGGESPFILEHRKMETREKIKRVNDFLSKMDAAFYRETAQAVLGIAFAVLCISMISFETQRNNF